MFQSIIDTHDFGGDIHSVELQILILLVWVGRNGTKIFIIMIILLNMKFCFQQWKYNQRIH